MEEIKNKILFSALGISGGAAGIVLSARCSGNACTSCLGCAGIGAGLLLIVITKKLVGGQKNNGMA